MKHQQDAMGVKSLSALIQSVNKKQVLPVVFRAIWCSSSSTSSWNHPCKPSHWEGTWYKSGILTNKLDCHNPYHPYSFHCQNPTSWPSLKITFLVLNIMPEITSLKIIWQIIPSVQIPPCQTPPWSRCTAENHWVFTIVSRFSFLNITR